MGHKNHEQAVALGGHELRAGVGQIHQAAAVPGPDRQLGGLHGSKPMLRCRAAFKAFGWACKVRGQTWRLETTARLASERGRSPPTSSLALREEVAQRVADTGRQTAGRGRRETLGLAIF